MENRYLQSILAHSTTQQTEYAEALFRLIKWHRLILVPNNFANNNPHDTIFPMRLDSSSNNGRIWEHKSLALCPLTYKEPSWEATVDKYLACLAHEMGHVFTMTDEVMSELSLMWRLGVDYQLSPQVFVSEVLAWKWAMNFLDPIWSPTMQITMAHCLNTYAEKMGGSVVPLTGESSHEQNV